MFNTHQTKIDELEKTILSLEERIQQLEDILLEPVLDTTKEKHYKLIASMDGSCVGCVGIHDNALCRKFLHEAPSASCGDDYIWVETE